MGGDHPVFRDVEEVVEKMLVPSRSVSWREAAQTASKEVHVKKSYLGPGIESRRKTKG